MQEQEIFKVSDIEKLRDAESIEFSSWPEFTLDLSLFSKLKHLRINNRNFKNIDTQVQLEKLNVSPFRLKNDKIDGLCNLKELYLFESDYENVNFVDNMKHLHNLDIYYFPNLINIDALKNNDSIESLVFYSCKRLNNLDVLKSMKKLKKLHLDEMILPNIDFVRDIKNLNYLSLVGTNILNGDISPAKDLDFVAIDNRKHYNYRFDNETRTIHPVTPKGVFVPKDQSNKDVRKKGSSVEVPHFGELDIKVLDMDYETDMSFNAYRVDLELHFEEETITKSKLSQAIKLLQNVEKDNDVILDVFKKDFEQGGVVKEYFDYFTDEVDEAKEDDFWQTLLLKRIAFYPHDDESYGLYDYGIDEISPYVLSLKVNAKGNITGCEMES